MKSENDKLKDAWKQSENEREETTRNILIKNLRKQVKIKRNMVKEAQEDAKIARETIAEFDDMNLYADVPDVVPENRNQCSSRSIFQTYKINN